MIPLNLDSVVEESGSCQFRSDISDEFNLRKGNFVAVVSPRGTQFEFFVRDLRREGPTIQGHGVDFPNAVRTVTQLLDALTEGE